MRKKIESKFEFARVKKLRDLFEEKSWVNIDEYERFFEKFCELLENLDEEQSSLVTDLTRDFLWIRYPEYFGMLKRALLQLESFGHLDLSTVYIFPLLTKKDREKGKTKSSKMMAYSCQNHELKNTELFQNTDFRVIDDVNHLPKPSKIEASNNPIILIDDFIGTGETAQDAITEVLSVKPYTNNHLFVLSLVCQKEGVELINGLGFNVLTEVIRTKGISDSYMGEEQKKNKRIMKEIEEILAKDTSFEEKYRFGYNESEALVSMIRTPNNTFPIYWYEANLGKGKKIVPPFPR